MQEPLLEALRHVPTAGLIFSLESRLRWANEAGLRLLQTYMDAVSDLPAEELFRQHLALHVAPTELAPERPVRATLRDGRQVHLEIRRHELDGPKDWGYVLYLTDVSHRYQAETLKADIQRYRQILEELPVEVVVLDAEDRFEYLNPAAIAEPELRQWLIGRTEQDLQARRSSPDEITEQRMLQVRKVRETGRPTQFEDEMVQPDGSSRYALRLLFPLSDDNGRIRRILGCGIEITDRVLAEKASRLHGQEMRESQLRYRRLFDQSRDVVSVSDADGVLVDVNRAGLDLLGYDHKDELLNMDVGQSVWLDPDARREVFRQARTRGYTEFETRFKNRRGEIRWVSGTMAQMQDDVGHPEGYLAIVRDVTEQRQVEEQLRQSQKMEAIGRLAGGIAHDFNNLLTAINGYCDLLLDDVPPGVSRSYVEEIEAAGKRASALTAKLLTLSRKEKSAPRIVELNHLVRELEGLLRRLIGEHIELEVETDSELLHVELDPVQMDQAILNLATNARDAMPRGGRLTLKTHRVAAPLPTDSSEGKSGSIIQLAVSDTGVGMDESVLAHIYEPFFTTKEAGQGTGLGLSTTYATVHRFGGKIEVDSTPGEGTRFVISFPESPSLQQGMETRLRSAPPSPGHETILLAEDDNIVRQLVTTQLTRQGYTVLAADNGEAALGLATDGARLDLLVSDVVMPGMSGPELALEVRRHFPDLPILFISGYAGSFLERHGFEEARHEVLTKPFTAKVLISRVRALLDGGEQGASAST